MNIQPRYTEIQKSIHTLFGMVVLENPTGFPARETNLYCLGNTTGLLWEAQKPHPFTLYSRVRFNEDGETLSAYTTDGHACELNLKTGQLIHDVQMK